MPTDNEVDEKAVAWLIRYSDALDGSPRQTVYTHNTIADWRTIDPGSTSEPLYSAATVAELRAEVAYYKENFQSCMTILNAINDAITEADEDGRGFVPVNQLENILTGADPT